MENVNSPNHYTSKSLEAIKVIAVMVENLDPFEAYCMGNIIKYLYRYEEKNGIEDLEKAKKHINLMIEERGSNDFSD